MQRKQWLWRAAVAVVFLASGACAVVPGKSSHSQLKYAPNAERDMLAAAAGAVERSPWPKSQPVSMLDRLTGSDGGGVSRSQAVDAYLAGLSPEGARFDQLAADARENLAAAARLNAFARSAMNAPRLSINDLSMIEKSIQALRANRQIYAVAAKRLAKEGEPVNEREMNVINADYSLAIKTLGELADQFANRIEDDRSQTYAAPAKNNGATRSNLSGT